VLRFKNWKVTATAITATKSMKKAIGILTFSLLILANVNCQQNTDPKENFVNAESYYLFEEFEEALPLYLKLHRAYPDNYNLYFKIGVCYLNNPYEKDKAVTYLEDAADHINPEYKNSNFKENGAPLDALYYLGNAYRINNQLDKARETYHKFLDQMDNSVYDDKLVKEQLDACDAAEKLMKRPTDLDEEILPNDINTRFADIDPTVSGDGTKMVFISKLQFYDAMYFTELKDGKWSPPRNITTQLGVDGDVYPTCLSYDGTLMFIYRNDDFVGNIYTSKYVDSSWTPIVKLNENINTKYWESHASITKDGNTLFFTSNRKDGYGGLDIYRSVKDATGEWGIPVNLGNNINTQYNEETPFITEDGKKLFFSSYGHYNMGGYDIFMSVMQNDSTWAAPVNIGFPINSTDDDVFFCPIKNGETAFYSVFKENGYGRNDIYTYQVYSADHPRKYEIKGSLNPKGGDGSAAGVTVSVIRRETGDTITRSVSDVDGNFTLSLAQGEYTLIFESKQFEKELKSLDITPETPHTGITLKEVQLSPKRNLSEINNELQLPDSLETSKAGESAIIDFKAEKGSVIIVKHYVDSVLVATDTIYADKRDQSYIYNPQAGQNNLEFTLIDKDGNHVTKSIIITGTEPQKKDTLTIITEAILKAVRPAIKPEKDNTSESNVQALVNDLSSRADGRLKAVLDSINLKKEGITSTEQLFRYLTENADKLGYSREDVDRLFLDMLSRQDLSEFVANLKSVSGDSLRILLSKLDLKAKNINTPLQLVEYLAANSAESGFTESELAAAIYLAGSGGHKNVPELINNLIQAADEGGLKVYLKSLDPNNTGASSPEEFIALLLKNAGESYTKDEVLIALTNLAVSRDATTLLNHLIAQSEPGALKDFLENLDLSKEGIFTSEQLITHIYANADLKGFTRQDADQLLQQQLYGQVEQVSDMKLKITALVTGPFKTYLEKLDLNRNSFGSREEFIDYLRSEAGKNGFTENDINNALLKLAYSGDLTDIIDGLTAEANGNLKKAIEKLDPQKEGIETFDELIRYLLDNSQKSGYSKADVYKMLSDYTAREDLGLFMNKLMRNADPETRAFLEKIDLKANSIDDRSELTAYLLNEAGKGTYDAGKITALLLEVSEIKLEDILPVLRERSTGELKKLLNSGKLPLEDFHSATDLYNYLIEVSRNNQKISAGEINKLFSDYLSDGSVNLFLSRMISHSDGKLKDFLEKIDLKKAGITTVSGLIQYLIDNSASGGFESSDIFSTIGRILERSRLADFIENLAAYAPESMKKLLNSLDLDGNGIQTVEDLMKYLTSHAAEYGLSVDDLWDAVLKVVVSGEPGAEKENGTPVKAGSNSGSLKVTAGLLGILAVLILIIVILKRKKNEEKK
jgi:hypothetical protein